MFMEMTTRFIIQLLAIGFFSGYACYREDHKIESESKPAPILYWLAMGLMFPLVFMWMMFLEALEKKN